MTVSLMVHLYAALAEMLENALVVGLDYLSDPMSINVVDLMLLSPKQWMTANRAHVANSIQSAQN